jgi:hypothetical protein
MMPWNCCRPPDLNERSKLRRLLPRLLCLEQRHLLVERPVD